MSSARAAAGRARGPQARPGRAATRTALAQPSIPALGRHLSIVRDPLAPPWAVTGTTRPTSRRGRPARPSAVDDGVRVHRIEDARRRAGAARAPVVDTRALLAEARIRWLDAALAVARLLGNARPAGAGGGAGAIGAPRGRAHDTRPGTGAAKPGGTEFGGVEAIAWFGEAR
jgi:hypothetical protein